MDSPEETDRYICTCGNTREFIGYDNRGYPGPAECRCEKTCECEVTLTQHFLVREDGSIDYDAFRGGGVDAEIGMYTRIQCAVCRAFIWTENPSRL